MVVLMWIMKLMIIRTVLTINDLYFLFQVRSTITDALHDSNVSKYITELTSLYTGGLQSPTGWRSAALGHRKHAQETSVCCV